MGSRGPLCTGVRAGPPAAGFPPGVAFSLGRSCSTSKGSGTLPLKQVKMIKTTGRRVAWWPRCCSDTCTPGPRPGSWTCSPASRRAPCEAAATAECLGPCRPHGRPGWSSRLLASPGPALSQALGSEPAGARSAFQVGEIQKCQRLCGGAVRGGQQRQALRHCVLCSREPTAVHVPGPLSRATWPSVGYREHGSLRHRSLQS